MSEVFYQITKSGSKYTLESGVMTNFGCMAWNYVKESEMASDLMLLAEMYGWTESKESQCN